MPTSAIVSRIAHDACLDAPAPTSGGRWWEELPADFADHPESFELALQDSVQVQIGATWDVVVRTAAACLVGGLALPMGYHPRALRRAVDDLRFYGPMAESHDPTVFFRRPPQGIRVDVHDARRPLFRPADGACLDIRFESPFEPGNLRVRRAYLSQRANRFAHARWWRHRRGPRPTVIAVHGFAADLYHVNEYFFALPWLYALGLDVMLFTLPFHGPRQSRLSPFSGYGFFAGGVSRINEAFAQSVCDLRVVVGHLLRAHGVPRVGVMGVSLGGYTSALLASVDDRISFSVPVVPVVSLADLVLEWQPLGAVLRGSLRAFRWSIEDVRHLLAVSSPLSYPPLLARERLMVIGGVADRLAPPKQSRLLWEHWGRCRLHWFPGNHVLHFDRGAYLRQLARFMRSVGFFEGLPRRPSRRRRSLVRRLLGRR